MTCPTEKDITPGETQKEGNYLEGEKRNVLRAGSQKSCSGKSNGTRVLPWSSYLKCSCLPAVLCLPNALLPLRMQTLAWGGKEELLDVKENVGVSFRFSARL